MPIWEADDQLVIQQLFIEHLLCPRNRAKQNIGENKIDAYLSSWGLSSPECACEWGREVGHQASTQAHKIMKLAKQDNMKPVGTVSILTERKSRLAGEMSTRGPVWSPAGWREQGLWGNNTGPLWPPGAKNSQEAVGRGCPELFLIVDAPFNSIVSPWSSFAQPVSKLGRKYHLHFRKGSWSLRY